MFPRELRQYTNKNVFTALIAMIVVAFIATGAAIFTINALRTYRTSAQSHNDLRVNTEQLVESLETAETSQRGYLLTGDSSYLNLYKSAVANIPGEVKLLDPAQASPAERSNLTSLQALTAKKLAELQRTVDLRQAGDTEGAISLFRSGQSQQYSDDIHVTAGRVLSAEQNLLTTDRDRADNLARLASLISVISMAATLGLTALVYWLYLKAIQTERRLDRAKDEFVSLASHQLRTPATGIKSILATLVAGDFGPLNERQAYFMRRALESNERELGIIEELLNVAKVDAGRLILHATRVNIDELVRTVVEEQRPAIAAKNQKIALKLPHHAVPIMADEEKLYMAIGNLLDNARKYTPSDGQIAVAVNYHHGQAQVEVSDNGIGIESTELKHIFDRFHRASDALTGNVEGTGLGLYLASRIAELHKGSLEVASRVGKGTKFVMILPQGDIDAAEGSVS